MRDISKTQKMRAQLLDSIEIDEEVYLAQLVDRMLPCWAVDDKRGSKTRTLRMVTSAVRRHMQKLVNSGFLVFVREEAGGAPIHKKIYRRMEERRR